MSGVIDKITIVTWRRRPWIVRCVAARQDFPSDVTVTPFRFILLLYHVRFLISRAIYLYTRGVRHDTKQPREAHKTQHTDHRYRSLEL